MGAQRPTDLIRYCEQITFLSASLSLISFVPLRQQYLHADFCFNELALCKNPTGTCWSSIKRTSLSCHRFQLVSSRYCGGVAHSVLNNNNSLTHSYHDRMHDTNNNSFTHSYHDRMHDTNNNSFPEYQTSRNKTKINI